MRIGGKGGHIAIALLAATDFMALSPSPAASPADHHHRAATSTSPGFLTVEIGRSLYSKGVNCQTPAGMLTLDQVVPALVAMGIHVTAAVVTDRSLDTGVNCVNGDLYPSWADLGSLRDTYGLTAISASLDHYDITTLSTTAQFQQSCGSLVPLIAHGHHRAWGMFAYPDGKYTTAIQATVVENCFAFGRTFINANVPSQSSLVNSQSTMASPWLQVTADVGGGRCNDRTQPCSKQALRPYTSPLRLASLANVAAGTWTDLQFYSFVSGTSTTGPLRWDCSNSNWADHWTNKFEVYCWNDVLAALSHVPSGVVITDPATVAEAWGRIPSPLVVVNPANPSSLNASTPSTTVSWYSEENGTYTVLVGGVDCNSGTSVGGGSYTTTPSPVSVTVMASQLSPGQNTIRVCLVNDAAHTGSGTTPVTLVPAPTVSGVAPPDGPVAGNTSISISGTNFTSDATVSVGGSAATGVVVNSPTSITAVTPAATSAGSADVVITEAGGTSATSTADQFLYEAAPTVSGVSPPVGPVAGGTQVTITGTNFYAQDPNVVVMVGGQPATSVTVTSSTTITAVVPAASAPGPVDVTVTEGGGTSSVSASDQYTYI